MEWKSKIHPPKANHGACRVEQAADDLLTLTVPSQAKLRALYFFRVQAPGERAHLCPEKTLQRARWGSRTGS